MIKVGDKAYDFELCDYAGKKHHLSDYLGKRDGKAVSYIGTFNPLVEENQIKLNEEEVLKFLKNGAQPTETVKSLLVKSGTWAKFEESKKNK